MAVDLLRLAEVETVSNDYLPDGSIEVVAELTDKTAPPICPSCGGATFYKHGTRRNKYADTPIEMRPTSLIIEWPRYRCRRCRTMPPPVLGFLNEKRRATTRLVDAIKRECLNTTFSSIAAQTGLAVNTIKNIALDLIEEIEAQVRFETPVIMGLDEVHLGGTYRAVVTNLATRTVFDMLEDRKQEFLKKYFKQLPDKDKVEWVCSDMWRPFKKSFREGLPNATLVIDKFHVVRMASDALEKERKKYQTQLDKDSRLHIKKTVRWLFLHRPSELTDSDREDLALVCARFPNLAAAYELKEAFYQIYEAQDKNEAIKVFEEWCGLLPIGEFHAYHEVAETVKRNFDDIFAYWDAPFILTNGFTKASNGITKMLNRMGRGYNFEMIRAKVLYRNYAKTIGQVSTNAAKSQPQYGTYISTNE